MHHYKYCPPSNLPLPAKCTDVARVIGAGGGVQERKQSLEAWSLARPSRLFTHLVQSPSIPLVCLFMHPVSLRS